MSATRGDDEPVAGGSGRTGEAVKRLRRARPAPEVAAQRLLDGRAWADFCDGLRAAGEHVLRAGAGLSDSPELRAEGFRYLLGLVGSGIGQATHLADPDFPRFFRNPESTAKWGAENADNQYLWARIRPDASYRITGRRNDAFDFLIEVKEGYMQLGDDRSFATLTAGEIELAPGGSFEILLAAERPAGYAGPWLELHPEARYVAVRQYFRDWATERPAEMLIEQIGQEGRAPAPLTPERMAHLLDDAGEWTLASARFWTEWVDQLRAAHRPGEVAPARRFVGGADAIYYGNDLYRLAPDEALVIESEVPEARYWQLQLCDLWFRTMDYANRQTSLNDHQARIDPDGRVRCVVAHRDPGVANWLDTGGQQEGVLQYRWIWSRTNPLPTVRVVEYDELASALPPETPRVAPEERRAAIHERQRHVARREPAA